MAQVSTTSVSGWLVCHADAMSRKCGGSHFLLRRRRTLLLDCPRQDAAVTSASAQVQDSGSGAERGDRGGFSATGCVLTEPSGQRSFSLDDVFFEGGAGSNESSPHAQGHRGEPLPVSGTDHSTSVSRHGLLPSPMLHSVIRVTYHLSHQSVRSTQSFLPSSHELHWAVSLDWLRRTTDGLSSLPCACTAAL